MPIEYRGLRAVLQGMVEVEEADALLAWLQDTHGAEVDLAGCTHLHPANLQVLLAGAVRVAEWPHEATLRTWLEPVLGRNVY